MRDWLSYRARIDPGGEALVDAAVDDSYTFDTLDTLVDDLAGRLVDAGVEPGDHLGAVLSPRVEYVCLIHAAMRLGVTLVPMGAGLTPRELAKQVAAADVTTVVCEAPSEDAVADALGRRRDGTTDGDSTTEDGDGDDTTQDGGGDDITQDGDADDITQDGDADDTTQDGDGGFEWGSATDADAPGGVAAPVDGDGITAVTVDDPETDRVEPLSTASPAPLPSVSWSLSDTQLVVFTSGTTGDPKAVRLTTGNLLASAAASAFRLGFDPGDRWLVTLPLHHAGGLSPVLRMPVYGMTVVLRREFDAGATADDLDRYDATAVSLVPTMLRRMLDRRGTLAESLRIVLLGGAPASPELIERCRNYSVPVHPTYGMTETASQIATARPAAAFETPEAVGPPLFLTDVTVVDADGEPVPTGEPGELVVDGPTVTPGYYDDDAATDAAFGAFGLHTGDVGTMDDSGALTLLNRLDDRIVTGGETVDPGEVADVLAGHPAVQEAAVVGVADAEWGQRVAAAVVAESGAGASVAASDAETSRRVERDDLLDFARERLAAHKLPKTVTFAESLPRTVSGTVDRDALARRFAGDSAPDDPDDAGGSDGA